MNLLSFIYCLHLLSSLGRSLLGWLLGGWLLGGWLLGGWLSSGSLLLGGWLSSSSLLLGGGLLLQEWVWMLWNSLWSAVVVLGTLCSGVECQSLGLAHFLLFLDGQILESCWMGNLSCSLVLLAHELTSPPVEICTLSRMSLPCRCKLWILLHCLCKGLLGRLRLPNRNNLSRWVEFQIFSGETAWLEDSTLVFSPPSGRVHASEPDLLPISRGLDASLGLWLPGVQRSFETLSSIGEFCDIARFAFLLFGHHIPCHG